MAAVINNFVGFESGGLEEAVYINASPTVGAYARTGSYGVRVTTSGDVAKFSCFEGNPDAYTTTKKYHCFGFNFRTPETSWGDATIFTVRNYVGGDILYVDTTTSQQLRMEDNLGTTIATSGTLSADTDYYVEVFFSQEGSGASTLKAWINGTQFCNSTTANNSTYSSFPPGDFGPQMARASMDFRFDDLYFMSGLSDESERLGANATSNDQFPEVRAYRSNKNSATPDSGNDLTSGTWLAVQTLPFSASIGATYDGALSGLVATDDLGGSSAGGPNGDTNITGELVAIKGIWKASRGNGGGTDHFGMIGRANSGLTTVGGGETKDLDLATSAANYAWSIGRDAGLNVTLTEYDQSQTKTGLTGRGSIYFKPDGTKAWTTSGTTVYQWALSTAWDITTATSDGTFSVASQTIYNNTWAVCLAADGTKLYVSDYGTSTSDYVFQYSLGTAWSIGGTVTYDNKSWNPNIDCRQMQMPTNDKMIIYDSGLSAGYGAPETYTFGTAKDITTLTAGGAGPGGSSDHVYRGGWVNESGNILVAYFYDPTVTTWIEVYELATAYDVSSATLSHRCVIDHTETSGAGRSLAVDPDGLYIIAGNGSSANGTSSYGRWSTRAKYPATNEYLTIGMKCTGPQDFELFDALAQVLHVPPAANDYTLQIDTQTYTLSGQTADLTRALQFDASAGSFTLSGQTADLNKGYTLNAEAYGNAGIFYLDASDSAVSGSWTDKEKAYDGDLATYAYQTTYNDSIVATGSNAPTTGFTITSVAYRAYLETLTSESAVTSRLEWSSDPFLVEVSRPFGAPGSGWTAFKLATEPTGGWTWQKVNDLKARFTAFPSVQEVRAFKAEVQVVGTPGFVLTGSDATLTYNQGQAELNADAGAYALTGQAANFTVTIQTTAGSYALTGQAADLLKAKNLQAVTGSYALTGQAADLEVGIQLSAGSFALSGSDAGLSWTRTLMGDAGSYALSGEAADLDITLRLQAETGSYALSGSDADLDLTLRFQAEAGSYALAGELADLDRGFVLALDAGSFDLAGQAAELDRTLAVLGEAGAYALSGSDANLLRALRIAQDAGSYTLAGSDADLDKAKRLDAVTGAYDLTGQAADLDRGFYLALDAGSFTLAGELAELDVGYQVDFVPGSFAVTGSDADLDRGFALAAEAGSYASAGELADLERALVLGAETGTYSQAGQAADLDRGFYLAAEAGAITLAGQAAELDKAFRLAATAGSYALTGSDANLQGLDVFQAETGSFTLAGQLAELLRSLRIEQSAGTYTLAGAQAAFALTKTLSAETGAYSLAGTDADLDRTFYLALDAGSYALTGSDANLSALGSFDLSAEAGSFALAGAAADLERALRLQASAGAYSLAGSSADLEVGIQLDLEAGAYTLSGQPAKALRSLRIAAEAGTYTIAGAQANLAAQKLLSAVQGQILVAGQVADLERGYYLGLQAGSYSLAGQDAGLDYQTGFPAESGAYQLQGQDALLVLAGFDPLESSDRVQVRIDDRAIPIRVDDRITKITI